MNRIQLFALLLFSSVFSIAWKADFKSSPSASTPLLVNESTRSALHFSMDSCSAWVLAGTKRDYTEFTGETVIDSACSDISVFGGYLFRDNPDVNAHSCTEGINGTPAMCISSADSCNYDPDDPKKLKINIELSPGPSGLASLSTLSFYEQAPDTFQWLDGPSGPNNYPTLYALRILKEGSEIYRQDSIATGRTWSLQNFNFSLIPEFTVTENTLFNIELLPYCLAGIDAPVNAWDIDEIEITSICFEEVIDGGHIMFGDSTTTINICSADGIPDFPDVILEGNSGTENQWVITDSDLNIIALPDSMPYNFEGSQAGTCKIWHISFEGPVTGLETGRSISTITGCLGVSNSLDVNKILPEASSITDEFGSVNVAICTGDTLPDYISPISSGGTGDFAIWVVTDTSGTILQIIDSIPVLLNDINEDECLLYKIDYNSEISGLVESNTFNDLAGCFAISNAINIIKATPEGGAITTQNGLTEINLCFDGNQPDSLNVVLFDAVGPFSGWLITDTSNNIVDNTSTPPFTLASLNLDTCFIWHYSAVDSLTGNVIGQNVSNLEGCFDLSNSVQINKMSANGGTITSDSLTEIHICQANFSENIIEVNLMNASGALSTWMILDAFGEIVALPDMPPFDFTDFGGGVYNIYHISHSDSLSALEIGSSFNEINGECFSFSNPLVIDKEVVDGGSVSHMGSKEIDLCLQSDTTDFIFLSLADHSGTLNQWVVTNLAGEIIDLPLFAPFRLDATVTNPCLIWNVSSSDTIPELVLGGNLADLNGCVDVSDSLVVNKKFIDAGTITVNNAEFASLCDSELSTPVLTVNSTPVIGEERLLVLTNEGGNIIDFPADSIIDFSIYADGIYNIYQILYNDTIVNNQPGNNINLISGDCFDISNNVTISLNSVDGGVLSTDIGDVIDICSNGIGPEPVNVVLENEIGSNKNWIITDANGIILEIDLTSPFDISTFENGSYLIWHLSYAPGISGMQIGTNVSEITGCFDFSNAISVSKQTVKGGIIESPQGDNIEFCVGDGVPDILEVSVSEESGESSAWIITDDQGIILETTTMPPFNFDGSMGVSCSIYHLSYNGSILGLETGDELTALEGCFDLSNAIVVIKNEVVGASILFEDGTDMISICLTNDEAVEVQIQNAGTGNDSAWIVTDTSGVILDLPAGPPFQFAGSSPDICYIQHINYSGMIEGLAIDSSISELTGCYALSNELVVEKNTVTSPQITFADSTSLKMVCLNNPSDLQFDVIDFIPSSSESLYILITPQGVILDIFYTPSIQLSAAGEVVCFIRKVNYIGDIEGMEIGLNANDLTGCIAVSNQIRIQKTSIEPSTIAFADSSVTKTICINEGMTEAITAVVTQFGNGPFSIWIATSQNGEIVSTSTDGSFDFSMSSQETCIIQRVDYSELSGFDPGMQLSEMEGCYAISNQLVVNKLNFSIESYTSSVLFDMNTCDAFISTMDNEDYSELVGVVNNDPQCTQLSVISGSLYVNNPNTNIHSCTTGLDSTFALCISSVDQCTYPVDHELALRFDIQLIPSEEGVSGLTSLSFYEQAPLQFDHYDGLSGDNNYPTKYGLRILKDGEVVYTSAENMTSNIYTLQNFSFDGEDDFIVTDTAIFSFEITPYCLAGINSEVTAWDIEDLRIESNCIYELLGGNLLTAESGLETQVCTDDGIDDDLSVLLFGAQGPEMAWVLTDNQDSIIGLPAGPTFNFEGSDAGICFLRNLSYTSGLTGLEVGNYLEDLQGCYVLSNAIKIEKETLATGGCNAPRQAVATKMMIRPNPGLEYLIIATDEPVVENSVIRVYNRLGQIMLTKMSNESETEIDISDLSPGYYFIRLDSGHQRMIESFVKI